MSFGTALKENAKETGKLWSKEVHYVCIYYVEFFACLLVNKQLRLIGSLVCLYSIAPSYEETGCTAFHTGEYYSRSFHCEF